MKSPSEQHAMSIGSQNCPETLQQANSEPHPGPPPAAEGAGRRASTIPGDAGASPPSRRPNRRSRMADETRRRAVQACSGCRRLKERCDGRQPCARCARTGRPCHFGPVEASASRNNDGGSTERVKCLERLVVHFLGDIPLDVHNLRRIIDKVQTGEAASQIDPDEAEALTLEEENFTVKTLSQHTSHYSGEFSHWNFSQKVRRRLSQYLSCSDPENEPGPADQWHSSPASSPDGVQDMRGSLRILEFWRATQLQSPKSYVLGVLKCLPPRDVAEFLVQIYFRFAQVNCFYVDEQWVSKKLALLYDPGLEITSSDSAWICVVLMVLAVGTQFAHMAGGPPGEWSVDLPSESAMERDVGVTFYQTASRLVPDIIAIASLESVQACLLLGHYALPLDTQGMAYTYLGLGMKMAIQNGMHRRYTGTDLDAWTVETRNRLWWTAYTMERRVGVLHGRPASISPTEMDADMPKDLSEFRVLSTTGTFANMSSMLHITLRLSDFANAITLLRRCPKHLQPTYLERIIDIRHKTHAWWLTLSPEIQHPNPQSPDFRSSAHLKLCYHLNDIFIGRPFIFHDAKQTSAHAEAAPSSTPQTSRPSMRATLAAGAVNAAFEVVELCRMLHEATGLARASYTEFSSCRAALLVLLAQSVSQRTERGSAALALGMRLMRFMASGGSISARSETSVIEALEEAVRRLHSHESAAQGGYERYKRWASLWREIPGAEGSADDESGAQVQPWEHAGHDLQRLDIMSSFSPGTAWPTASFPELPWPADNTGHHDMPGSLGFEHLGGMELNVSREDAWPEPDH